MPPSECQLPALSRQSALGPYGGFGRGASRRLTTTDAQHKARPQACKSASRWQTLRRGERWTNKIHVFETISVAFLHRMPDRQRAKQRRGHSGLLRPSQRRRNLASHVRSLVANPVARGKGYAVKTGMLRARGDLVFFMDADLSVPLRYIPVFLRCATGADVLIGSRR